MYIDILDNMNWSFSRLNSFYSCKRNWYYNYIMKKESSDNFFSQYGTFAHKIFEYYNKGKMELFEMSKYYSDNFNNEITMDAPPKYRDWETDRKSTRLNSSHSAKSRMPSSA